MPLGGNGDFLGYFLAFGHLSSLLPFQFDDLDYLSRCPLAVLVHQLGIVVLVEVYVLVVSVRRTGAAARLFTITHDQGVRGTVRFVLFRQAL